MHTSEMTPFEYVSYMNESFGNPKGDCENINWERLTKQCKNILDERNEYRKALKECDIDQVRDALCDIAVFALGAYHFMGSKWHSRLEFANETKDFFTNPDKELPAELYLVADRIKVYYHLLNTMLTPQNAQDALTTLSSIIEQVETAYNVLTISFDVDMHSVLDGVMTRFIKDDADKEATIIKHATNGTTDVYFEGEYPTMIMKSASDQLDAPKGKFLKSASYKDTVFVNYNKV